MRFITLTAAALLTACMGRPALEIAPRMKIAVADLAIETSAGRATLRQRVAAAARQFCAAHGDEIAPRESRTDPFYCPDMMRSEIMGGMTPDIRRAYMLARREAGIHGRNL
jgi:UrcA family protein